MSPGSFDAAVAGCRYVIHVASPVTSQFPSHKARELLIEPAVRGVENVLAAVDATPSVEAVVVTGSVAALMGNCHERGRSYVYTETDWCETASEHWLPYNASKVAAERRAWELHGAQQANSAEGSHGKRARRWRLVVMLAAFVVGPPASLDIPAESVTFAKDLAAGRFGHLFPHSGYAFVGTRHVHVRCMLSG